MFSFKSLRPTPAMLVAVAALVMAMSGAAIALPGKGSVDSRDLAKGSVTTKSIAKGAIGSKQIDGKSIKGNRLKDGAVKDDQLADGAVTAAKIAGGAISGAALADGSVTTAKIADNAVVAAKIADGAVTAAKVGNGTLSTKNLSDDAVVSSAAGSFVKLTATEAASEAAARTAAPETTLFSKGAITITAKCFRDTGGDQTFSEMYVATATNGAVFNGANVSLEGGNAATDFLNTDTDPADRVLDSESATGNDAAYNEGEFTILGPDGTSLIGQTSVGAKNGTLAGGNGVYGAGNVCVFGAEIAG